MKVGIVINWGRSGGTLLNRCIGSLPNVMVLSEVSPLRNWASQREPLSVRQQASEWYGINLSTDDFGAGIRELEHVCESRGQRLVLRLWNVGEFRPSRQKRKPPNTFLSYDLLRAELHDVTAIAFIRDPIDIWISNGCKRDFFRYYRRYIEALFDLDIPVFKYEDFCANPNSQMRAICRALQLPFDEHFREFSAFDRVAGDRQVQHSRGYSSEEILVLPRKQIATSRIRWVNRCEDMKAANSIADYPPNYYGMDREPWPQRVRAELQNLGSIARQALNSR